ncbi:serine hydrolase domain-containing protein [Vallitalea okinawensis]|uniref:serine hydrolase domain-containing protein n=1 Tax=Vallitalea okinawensis TaxID=2078660 RepID=UPI000CFB0992|nr:serine hydrolase domain-containing protein [Vallitalea okinawensis]
MKELVNILDNKYEDESFSGVVVIHQDNKEIFSMAGGYANRSFKVPNQVETRFRIASVGKMFTAVAVLQLIEKGLINLETKVRDYLQLEDTKISKDVTIRHLLNHSSGIADYCEEADGDEAWELLWKERPIYHVRVLKDYLELFKDKSANFPPGEKFKYCNAGYVLLGLVIEKAAQMDYFEYVRKNIFEVLQMKDTDFIHLDHVVENVAEGYELMDHGWERNIYTATPGPGPDGGATSTAKDLLVFIKALQKGQLINEELTNMMLSPQIIDEEGDGFKGYKWRYGFANYILLDEEDRVVRGGHTGEEYGVSCRIYYYPEKNIDVAIVGNIGFCAGKLGWEIHDCIMNK